MPGGRDWRGEDRGQGAWGDLGNWAPKLARQETPREPGVWERGGGSQSEGASRRAGTQHESRDASRARGAAGGDSLARSQRSARGARGARGGFRSRGSGQSAREGGTGGPPQAEAGAPGARSGRTPAPSTFPGELSSRLPLQELVPERVHAARLRPVLRRLLGRQLHLPEPQARLLQRQRPRARRGARRPQAHGPARLPAPQLGPRPHDQQLRPGPGHRGRHHHPEPEPHGGGRRSSGCRCPRGRRTWPEREAAAAIGRRRGRPGRQRPGRRRGHVRGCTFFGLHHAAQEPGLAQLGACGAGQRSREKCPLVEKDTCSGLPPLPATRLRGAAGDAAEGREGSPDGSGKGGEHLRSPAIFLSAFPKTRNYVYVGREQKRHDR